MDPITILVAVLAAGAILLIFMGLAGSAPVDPVQARLTQLGSMQAKNLEELELQQPLFERTLRPLAARLSGSVARVTSQSFSETTEKRLALAGNPGDLRVADWLGIKAVGAIVGAILFVLLFVFPGLLKIPVPINFLMILVGVMFGYTVPEFWLGGRVKKRQLVGVMFGYTVPEFWLGGRVKKRQKAILLQIPDALDLLTISVRAGLGFDGALAKVVEKLKGPLTDEFRRALAEIRVGKARRDALRDIVPRTEVPPLTNFIGAIIQAEQLGVSISKVLQVQSEQLRIERRQRAEEMAAKAPIKMLFPLVGCIFPSLFIVILGPAIILIVINLKT
jgi:tight adherence protein C